ncbi:MAG: hypothetical protein ACJAW1_000709 [Glaciecola sp.]|jgi:hypothetical protein
MQLNNLLLDVTPKTSWQCFDLGCKVALANFKSLFLYWIVLTLPIFVIAISINLGWGPIIFWLFKPLYERGLLYILSRTVFGTHVSILQTLLNLPSQIKPLWFSSITYRRLTPSRSFDMAVAQLENLSGKARSERLNVLHKTKDDNTAWWTICCVHWELFLTIGLFSLIQILLPADFNFQNMLESLTIQSSVESYIINIVFYIAIAVVAPFYVAGGFVAYLNRRVVLEGWDIELGFTKWHHAFIEKSSAEGFSKRSIVVDQSPKTELNDEQIVEQQNINEDTKTPANKSSTKVKLPIVIIFLFGNTLLGQDIAFAQPSKPFDAKKENASSAISVSNEPAVDEIALTPIQIAENENVANRKNEIRETLTSLLDEPPFAQYETVINYRWKSSEDDEKEEDETDTDFTFLAWLVKFIASSSEIILWGLFIFFFGYLIFRNWAHLVGFFGKTSNKEDYIPMPSFISSVFTEALPKDIIATVNESINNNDYRRALSILVRASFTYLSKTQHIRITKSMTEKECLDEIKRSSEPTIYAYMQDLLSVWMKMAWAHQLPDAHTLERLSQQYDSNFVHAKMVEALNKKGDSE